MMPDLGKYATEVLGAYLVALLLLAVLVGWSLLRSTRMRRQLEQFEERRRNGKQS